MSDFSTIMKCNAKLWRERELVRDALPCKMGKQIYPDETRTSYDKRVSLEFKEKG